MGTKRHSHGVWILKAFALKQSTHFCCYLCQESRSSCSVGKPFWATKFIFNNLTLLVLLLHDCLSTTSFQRNRLGFDSLVMGSLLIQMESTSRRIYQLQSHVSSLMACWESVQCCLCCQCCLSVQSCTYTHPLARSINKQEKNAFSVWQRFDK